METLNHTTTALHQNDKFSENPLEWRTGLIAFFVLVFGGVAVSVIVCSDALTWSNDVRSALLKLFVVWTAFGLFAFVACKERSGFVPSLLLTIVLAGPVVAMMLAKSTALFWITFFIVGCMGVLMVIDVFEEAWKKILVSIYSAGIAVSVFVTVGLTEAHPTLSYAQPAQALSDIFPLLDVRLFACLVFTTWLGMNAILQTFRAGMPIVKPLPQSPQLGDANVSRPVLEGFLEPLLFAINMVLKAVRALANILWVLIAIFMVFVNRTGVHLANHISSLLFNKGVWNAMMQVMLTLGTIMLFAVFLTRVESAFDSYLRSTVIFYEEIDAAQSLLLISAFSLLIIFSIIFVCWLLNIGDNIPSAVGYGLSTILVAFSIAGGLMYALSRIEPLKIVGFDAIGLFSFSMVVLLTSIVVFYLGKYTLKR